MDSRCLACGTPYRTHGRRCPALPLPRREALLQGLVLLGFGSIVAWAFVGWIS